MKLFWNYIENSYPGIWVATTRPLKKGDYIYFRDTVGFIERQKDGTYSCYDGPTNRFLGNEPNKKYGMARVANKPVEPTANAGPIKCTCERCTGIQVESLYKE